MEKNKEIKIGAMLSYVIIFLNMIIGVLYTPLLTYKLGQAEYGLYSLISTIISYLTVLDFGFGNAIIIYTSKYITNNEREKESKLYGMFLIIYTVIGIFAGIISIILTANIDNLFKNSMNLEEINRAKILMSILTINLVFTFPLSIFSYIITAHEKFIFLKLLNIIRIILNPVIMYVLLNLGFKSIALVILITILNLLTLIINGIYCKVNLHTKFIIGKIDFSLLREIMGYSVWVFLSSIMDKINWNIDQFILGMVSGTVAVAIYSVASQLSQMYMSFSTAISSVLLPKAAQMEANKATDEEFSKMFIKTGRIQFLIMALIVTGFVLYGREFITLMWVGPDYNEAYIIACVLMIPLTIPLIQNVGLNIIQAKNQYKYRVKVLFIFAIINLAISVALAKMYGGIGAAIGTAISIVCGQIIFMNIFYYRNTHINIPKFWKEIYNILKPICFIVIFAILIKKIMPIFSIEYLVFEIVIYIILYCIFVYKYAMNEYEKVYLKKFLIKFIKKRDDIYDKN